MAFTESDLLEALKAVVDPNTGRDFVSTTENLYTNNALTALF